MNKKKFDLREYMIITLGVLITAAGVYFFMIPGHIVVGSLSGLVLVLSNFVPLPISVMTFLLNALLLVFGFIVIGREFGAKTIYTSILLPAFLRMFEVILPNQKSLTGDVILDTLCYVLTVSVGLAMLFNANASSGGLDIIAKFLNKYFHIELGKSMTIAGMCTAVTSILVYDTKTLVISILATYFNGIVLDHFIDGFHVRKRVCILSDHHGEIREYIMKKMHRGVTLYQAWGGYDNREKIEIQTILTRSEYGVLMNYIRETDPNAFITVSTVSEVIGQWGSGRKTRSQAND